MIVHWLYFNMILLLIDETLKRNFLQHFFHNYFICPPADSTVSEDAGIEPRGLNFKELLRKKLRFTCGWAEVLSMAHIVHILIRVALLSVPITVCVCVSLVHCKHPVTFLCVPLHSASLDSHWLTDTDEYLPMPERPRKDSPNLISHLSEASKQNV